MLNTFLVTAFAAGDPTWGYALLGMLILTVVLIGIVLLFTRNK